MILDIQDRVLKIVNSYDYNNDIDEVLNEYKKELSNQGPEKIINLNVKINNQFIGSNAEEVVQKVASQVIQYRKKEKTFIKLMSEGIIYPVGMCDGLCQLSLTCCYGNTTSHTHLNFRRIVFDEFMKA